MIETAGQFLPGLGDTCDRSFLERIQQDDGLEDELDVGMGILEVAFAGFPCLCDFWFLGNAWFGLLAHCRGGIYTATRVTH